MHYKRLTTECAEAKSKPGLLSISLAARFKGSGVQPFKILRANRARIETCGPLSGCFSSHDLDHRTLHATVGERARNLSGIQKRFEPANQRLDGRIQAVAHTRDFR